MAENKTKATTKSVPDFLKSIEDPVRKNDCLRILSLMEELSGSKPKMWADSLVGFGNYRYKYIRTYWKSSASTNTEKDASI